MKRTILFATMLAGVLMARAQIPYVYDKEYSGKEFKMKPVVKPEELPLIEKLPDPFKFQNGKRSTDFKDWEQHRYEISQLFQQYEIGMRPVLEAGNLKAVIEDQAPAPAGGNRPGGFGGFGGYGNNGAAAASLGAQATAYNNTDLLMNAINGTDADIRALATMSNSDFDSMKTALATLNAGLINVGSQIGMSSLQVINAIQSGNAALASQLCQCCCENKLLVTQQGYESQIATLNQTNQLSAQADRNANAIVNAINAQTVAMNDQFCAAKERDLQLKIDTQADLITQLRGQIDNAAQTAQIASLLAPIRSEVEAIKASQPNTVPVQWPNLVAVNNTPYSGFYGYGYGNGGSYWG